MYFSQLLTLSSEFSKEFLEKADTYFAGLSNTARKHITVSKLADAIQSEYQLAARLIQKCLDLGFLEKHFALRCPTCETPICEINSLSELNSKLLFCSVCEKDIEPDELNFETDIILLFSIKSNDVPFVTGQQSDSLVLNASERTAVHTDSFLQGVQYQLITFDDVFALPADFCEEFSGLIKEVKGIHQTTTAKGASLELLICKLFSQCILFKITNRHKSETNQIDVMVRAVGSINSRLFKRMGGCFYIECKNEKEKPSIDYLLKLRSILHDADMKLGILVSKEKEPKTFRENANHIFLRDGIVIIRLCLNEIELLIERHTNLLELLEKKIMEVETAAQNSLGMDGLQLYNA